MSKKVKILVSVVAAVVLLAVGTATAVMAQDNGSASTSNTTVTRGLFARVAANLDITEEELIDAFKQAQQEIRQEMRQAWQERRHEACLKAIDKAVEKGLIDGDEADEIIEWWGEKPEALNRIWSSCFSGCSASGNGHMWNKRWHSAFGMQGSTRGWHGLRPPRLAGGV